MSTLRGIGYWVDLRTTDEGVAGPRQHSLAPVLPDPRRLVEVLGRQEPDRRVLTYLSTGHVYRAHVGYSYCRFGCGLHDIETGTTDLTDGTWVWPEGLAHYVDCHGVPLPDEFLTSLSERQWRVPLFPDMRCMLNHRVELTFWKTWHERQLLTRVPA